MKRILLLFLLATSIFTSCKTSQRSSSKSSENVVNITFLHLNDVYEISPLEGGKVGGMARLGTLRKELIQKNPNTVTILAGDFLNPSLIATFKYEGKSIKGRQMVEAMNSVGFDWVGLGNHEFDIDEADLQRRIDESQFNWLASNALQNNKGTLTPFAKNVNGTKIPFPKTTILTFKNATGKVVKMGMFSVVLPSNQKDYVHYDDFFESAKQAYEELKLQCDFVVGITHINKVDDAKLAKLLPDVKLLMGGHDHDNMLFKEGNVIIAKADANAKTAYVHNLSFDTQTKSLEINSELRKINEQIKDDAEVALVVKKWEEIMDVAMKKAGLDKNDVVADISTPLDGRESTMRNGHTNLGDLIAKAMSAAATKPVDCTVFNSGSVRIDDQLVGKITQLDIMRILPFGGKIVEVNLTGSLLAKILATGLQNKGNGGFLQWDKISYEENKKQWLINGKLLDINQEYRVMMPKFLIEGKETNFGYLTAQNPAIKGIVESDEKDVNDIRNDIRKVLIAYLKK
ncbi:MULTISPECIES: bifunctional metallophosphatase/5'-nucleotidase [unclassified Arcicella]|uniref:bifunctional metallophosphatase/5'-nucleotidase n=1 Tax=unclassified Arcicella TaxID=2644986 RepID=UPI00286726D1|nr:MULTISPECIES: bifunctional metallophosphatase/5'-nucleotidase [unclassified Arcicella]MDR6560287.1 2',3'-cyclic-nucleotide 2'-phosphodiesterase (5'-nucleotidase family) [Arcicella sp. BE51]MDR6810107.1 2',3'-cyclic-nucleotide 2'-phosphodiesterase (5'-nucleotidase family) [Arcicella sp. BE140]MDR6821456.1 2',3'-cyclic-nucleotide 2'-phosphodiesterase (5'-nucleotidase family) [Arcicella sp. BE139]